MEILIEESGNKINEIINLCNSEINTAIKNIFKSVWLKNTIGKYNVEDLHVAFKYQGERNDGSVPNTEIYFAGKIDDTHFGGFLKFIIVENYPHRDKYHANMYYGDVLTELSEDEINIIKSLDFALRKFIDKIDIGNIFD